MVVEMIAWKPKPREAIMYTGDNGLEIVEWMDWFIQDFGNNHQPDLVFLTVQGINWRVSPGDWVEKRGDYFMHLRKWDFDENYERVSL